MSLHCPFSWVLSGLACVAGGINIGVLYCFGDGASRRVGIQDKSSRKSLVALPFTSLWLHHQKSSLGTRIPPAMQAVSGWLGFKACKVSPFHKMDEVLPERKSLPPCCSWVLLSWGRNLHIINKNVTSLSMVWALNRHKNNRAGLLKLG